MEFLHILSPCSGQLVSFLSEEKVYLSLQQWLKTNRKSSSADSWAKQILRYWQKGNRSQAVEGRLEKYIFQRVRLDRAAKLFQTVFSSLLFFHQEETFPKRIVKGWERVLLLSFPYAFQFAWGMWPGYQGANTFGQPMCQRGNVRQSVLRVSLPLCAPPSQSPAFDAAAVRKTTSSTHESSLTDYFM